MKRIFLCISLLAAPLFSSALASEFDTDESTYRRGFVCLAASGFGLRRQVFRGHGFTRRQAQRDALRTCRRTSFAPRSCHIEFCRPLPERIRDRP